MVRRRVYDSERHAHFVRFCCYRGATCCSTIRRSGSSSGIWGPGRANAGACASVPEYWCQVERTSVWQLRYYGFNVFTWRKIDEKLTYLHRNPVRAGLVERAVDWAYSSAHLYEQHASVGLPIGWPPGVE